MYKVKTGARAGLPLTLKPGLEGKAVSYRRIQAEKLATGAVAPDDDGGRTATRLCGPLFVMPVAEKQGPTSPRKRGGHGAMSNRRNADLFAHDIAPIIAELKASSIVRPGAITDELRKRQVRTARRGAWHPTTVGRLLARLR
jgi:hypothetical protein